MNLRIKNMSYNISAEINDNHTPYSLNELIILILHEAELMAN